MNMIDPTQYKLKCVKTDREFADEGWMLDDPQCKEPSLVRTVYQKRQIEVKSDDYGLYKFADWLPVRRMLEGSAAPVTYKSEALAARLGLENLYITLSGYCPSRGATMTTCSFKETEAYSVCARIDERHADKVLVVASAGNTARAFAKVCSENNIRLLLAVPYDNLSALWFEKPLNPCVKLIACEKGGDYFDAINLSNIALKSPMFYAEGGAKNVARRDGMATTVLSAATAIGRIPDYYFQAVGSGTGAIAALADADRIGETLGALHEALDDEQTGILPRLKGAETSLHHIRTSYPRAGELAERLRSVIEELKDIGATASDDAERIDAKVLSNRKPPYSLAGGLYDALKASGGDIMVATNAQARRAKKIFLEKRTLIGDFHDQKAVMS